MIWLLWGGSVALALLAGIALGRRRPARKTTPTTLRHKADWHQEKGYNFLMRGDPLYADMAFADALRLRRAADRMEQQMLEDLR